MLRPFCADSLIFITARLTSRGHWSKQKSSPWGYYRFDNPNIVELMNDLYKNEVSQLHNFFYLTLN